MIKHRPTHDWIIAQKILAPETEAVQVISGVARLAQKPPHHYARVLAIGSGRAHPQTGYVPAPVCQVGDIVMVRAVAGDPENIEGTEYVWLMPDEVLAVVDPPGAVS
jgi:co-chaperonin GroES (HSP10)